MGLYTVRCKRPSGRWRAGRFFVRDADVYELNDDELAAVRSDPFFVIEDDPAPVEVVPEVKPDPEFIPANARRAKR